jgi:hypothetical protein
MNFKEFLESADPGSKTGLYPLGYGGIGLYPPAWYITRSADAIYYYTIDKRIYKSKDDGDFDISHLKGDCPHKLNNGESGTWSISRIKK